MVVVDVGVVGRKVIRRCGEEGEVLPEEEGFMLDDDPPPGGGTGGGLPSDGWATGPRKGATRG